MATLIHPTAVVDPTASLGADVVIGPLCHVGPEVVLGDRTELRSHAVLLGPTSVGADNVIHAHAVLGDAPQDRSHRGEPTRLEVGDRNVFREHVTVHRGTVKGGGVTSLGSDGLLMVGAHVAHDCVLGDRVTLTNNVSLGGHVRVEDGAVCGGHVAVAPFVRLGTLAFIAGGSMVERDVPPFVVAAGDRARVVSLNRVGLRRAGVPEASVAALRDAFRALFRPGRPLAEAVRILEVEVVDPYARQLVRAMGESLQRPAP